MKTNFLFPFRYKWIGWALFIPGIILGIAFSFLEVEPDFLYWKVPAIYVDSIFENDVFFGSIENNILDELIAVLLILGGIFIAFSKEKEEDELIAQLRLKSLVWATYFNYAILLIAILFIYDMGFYWVMVYNMFTILLFFIIRFHWQLKILRKQLSDEE